MYSSVDTIGSQTYCIILDLLHVRATARHRKELSLRVSNVNVCFFVGVARHSSPHGGSRRHFICAKPVSVLRGDLRHDPRKFWLCFRAFARIYTLPSVSRP